MDKKNHICGMSKWTKEHTATQLGYMRLYDPTGQYCIYSIYFKKKTWVGQSEKGKTNSTQEEMRGHFEYRKALMGKFAFSASEGGPIRWRWQSTPVYVCALFVHVPLFCCLVLFWWPPGVRRVFIFFKEKCLSMATVSLYYMSMHTRATTQCHYVWLSLILQGRGHGKSRTQP